MWNIGRCWTRFAIPFNPMGIPYLRCAFATGGEDALCAAEGPGLTAFGVADGCGGLGSRRYENLQGHTGAWVAARATMQALEHFVQREPRLPQTLTEGAAFRDRLEHQLGQMLTGLAARYDAPLPQRLTGSMQSPFPTTLCAALCQQEGDSLQVLLLHIGNSRACLWTPQGILQLTKDDLRGAPDAFDSLYGDVPLRQYLSGENIPKLHLCRLRLKAPEMLLLATDGAFDFVRSPMAWELLLWKALQKADSPEKWAEHMYTLWSQQAGDDASLLLFPLSQDHYGALRLVSPERVQGLTPLERVRRMEPLRKSWESYRKKYDQTEGDADGRIYWRL